jgi:murein DD-endopeptidase MepM/ murein hydrolase activator NlpD
MNPPQDSFPRENNSRNLFFLFVILILISGIGFAIIFFFKPKTKNFITTEGEIKNTPEKHIEAIEPSLLKIYNLTNEMHLLDELFDELIYSESPEPDRISEFVSNYRNYEALYNKARNEFRSSDWFSKDYDSTILSLDRQNKFLDNSIVNLMKSIDIKKKFFLSIPVSYPISKKDAQIVSGFGMRKHPILNEPRMHTGIDIKAPVGTVVVATASGKVIMTEEQVGYGYGRPCLIEHKFGYQTLYGHLVRLEVYKNKMVQKGDIIGRVGDTGLSAGPHLHYEVRKNGRQLNPSWFMFEGLTEKEYKEIVSLGTIVQNTSYLRPESGF